ncbi:hypothetical protein Kpol_1005p5 [Vanderwaltozyma polyspora DSM 70294]|uniref:Vacuolar ATPase assembly protein VMA22 n=1 Tax=Vanderwaltozyma polyspora (strain ATCC 22028 / DSM 70294 / BCRC 21397 / CBS 2163 / NBRC 10782 / NRRL Y-8283 / UCD 57-17) TaxID=436907 RepID=A7TS32_VANPO|nr:uncharacterized protein Kpol_1005p5 [Vanderwaltozyma polyspora DSM 70294]EDO14918.1 hypothetical protein Kpol_1005p5 [Vanderwaltozyma polyspora DSM 70294]
MVCMVSDESSLEVLELLSKYNGLLEQLQKGFGEGFSNLGRANYHNKDALRGRYGRDYWDETYEGELEVHISADSKTVEITKKIIMEEETEESDDEEKDSKLKNRSKVKGKQSEEKTKKKNVKVSPDPIFMFGGRLSIPSSLRQCQSNFKSCIPLFQELINCQRELIEIIEKNKK